MGKKAHSKSTFQDEWLTNKKFSDWTGITNKLSEAPCLVSNKSIDMSLTGTSGLDCHPKGAKHKKKGWTYRQSLTKTLSSQLLLNKRLLLIKKPGPSRDVTGTAKQGSIHVFTQKENSFNAETLWYLRMVLAHGSYNSCCHLSKLFGRMFPDSPVAKALTLGKTQCRYTMLYGIAPEFEQKLIFYIN